MLRTSRKVGLALRAIYLMSLALLVAAALAVAAQENGKQPTRLTEADVIALIGNQVEDQAILARIDKHQLAFQVDDVVLARIKQAHPSPAVLAALEEFRAPGSGVPGPVAPGKGGWQVLNSGVTDDLHDVAFLNDQVGVAVGANKTILRTTDGGKSWNRVIGRQVEDDYFASVVFGNDKVGYVQGNGTGNLYRTLDGGKTWHGFVNPNPSGLYSIKGFSTHAAQGNTYYWMNYAGSFSTLALYKTDNAKNWTKLWDHENQTLGGSGARMVFTDAMDGWMASTTHPGNKFWVGRSSDGGKTWASQEIKDKVRGGYMLIQAVNKDLGWFCSGNTNHVHASTDGGKTWTPYELGNGAADTVARLQFLDAKRGYALCGEKYHVRRTTDGGRNWTSLGELTPPDGVYGMFFNPSGVGYVVGSKGYIAKYSPHLDNIQPSGTDKIVVAGKDTWQVLNSGITDDLYGMAFINDQVGVTVGANRTILRTTDGGKSWQRVITPQEGVDLAAVVFGNDKIGWARTGDTGAILYTTDAGATWHVSDYPGPKGVFSRLGSTAHAAVGGTYFYQNCNSARGGNFLSQTTDLGKSWKDLWENKGELGGAGVDLAFPTLTDGWMASCSKSVPPRYFVGRSTDGGKTWQQQQIKDKVGGNYMLIQAVDKDRGWFCSHFSNHVHASTDGGKTWIPYELGNGTHTTMADLHFTDAKVGHVLCGQDWHVRQTTDGGKTWRSLGSFQRKDNEPVSGLYFRSANLGFVVGSKGYIAKYSAGN